VCIHFSEHYTHPAHSTHLYTNYKTTRYRRVQQHNDHHNWRMVTMSGELAIRFAQFNFHMGWYVLLATLFWWGKGKSIHYTPGQPLRAPGVRGIQILSESAYAGGKVVKPHVPAAFTPKILLVLISIGERGSAVVEALRYKPEGREIYSRWCHWNFLLR
jgi:hypothetical protein